MEFADLVMKRRTVRRFSDKPVDRVVLDTIVRLAQHTPSAGFSQGQRLVVVSEPERRRTVGQICEEDPEFGPESFGPWISICAAQFIPCVSEEIYHPPLPRAGQDPTRRERDRVADPLLVDGHRMHRDDPDAGGTRHRAGRWLRWDR